MVSEHIEIKVLKGFLKVLGRRRRKVLESSDLPSPPLSSPIRLSLPGLAEVSTQDPFIGCLSRSVGLVQVGGNNVKLNPLLEKTKTDTITKIISLCS